MNLKPYVELECATLPEISAGIYDFLQTETEILTNGVIGWQFLDYKKLLKQNSELLNFFTKYKLIPNNAAVTILTDSGQLGLHIDESPVVAKINIPVINNNGWVNQWYSISDEDLKKCPTMFNQFNKSVPDLKKLPKESFRLMAEKHNLDKIIVFNSSIPHLVDKTTATIMPRITASFTFYNEPLELLK